MFIIKLSNGIVGKIEADSQEEATSLAQAQLDALAIEYQEPAPQIVEVIENGE